ncbi:MAG: MlaE family lipid ABC transporter permease subunit [Candidatus Competibacteraceae bacterium]|jgi:phospholipid/cholesterol/gamma-HCH transport system permease protein|nr:MlaE family lipid ABC transporter permease subunit [Candidatus Competibacteraceae bacterium]
MANLTDTAAPANIDVEQGQLFCIGAWTLLGIVDLSQRLSARHWPSGTIQLSGTRIDALDTAGALMLLNLVTEWRQAGRTVEWHDWRPEYSDLLTLVEERQQTAATTRTPSSSQLNPLARIGYQAWNKVEHALSMLAFLGEITATLLRTLLRPGSIRWKALFANIQRAGLDALPIVGLLTFLIGVVIAYQGGDLLSYYGANIFIVDLVALSMVRELAPLLTAIIVAGRTGSAYTAQIGTMNVTEEVDALRTIGIHPFDVLVLPKLFGLILVLPLLTLFGCAMSILGGMVIASVQLDVGFREFLNRIPQVVSLTSFLYGIGKTPVFAAIIAIVGCYQGFQVSGGADSVGRQTTQSVVQAIFLVIIANAFFAVMMGGTGL